MNGATDPGNIERIFTFLTYRAQFNLDPWMGGWKMVQGLVVHKGFKKYESHP